ncbi:MAG: glycosyltransferase family 39 protein [Elusimicrobiota bacterium]
MSRLKDSWPWLAVFAAALLLRSWSLDYGLPAVFNSDEPFHVNVAVSFGGGTLNPGMFKYPTLWMYTLFGAYGVYFLAWSKFALAGAVRGFGELFVWHPYGFYFIARALAAAFSMGGLALAAVSGEHIGERRTGLWGAALLAVSHTLVVSAHAAKPDSQMFFLSAAALFFALRHFARGGSRDLLLAGAACGLAVSTQYTAAPLATLLPVAWWAGRRRNGSSVPLKVLVAALAIAAAAFFLGSPFILLDWPSFVRDMRDQMSVQQLGTPAGLAPFQNALSFGGPWVSGGVLALGAACLLWRDQPLALVLLVPSAAQALTLAASPEGDWARYLEGVFPCLALAAGFGVEALLRSLRRADSRVLQAVVLAVLMGPGFRGSWAFCREIGLPDTRVLAAEWIEKNLPENTSLLIDQEHASPMVRKCPEQVRGLLERTKESGHPRWRYYELMLSGHPGGGFRVSQILRGAADLHSGGWHSRWSAEGRSVLDVRSGLGAALAAGVEVVVLSSVGATAESAPELAAFLSETASRGTLLAEFVPVPGEVRGPSLRVFRVARAKNGVRHG